MRAVYESTRRKYGAVPMPVTVAAHHPEIFRATHALGVEAQGFSAGAYCVLPERFTT